MSEKCYAVYISPFYSGREKRKKSGLPGSGGRHGVRRSVYEKEKAAARSVPPARGSDRRHLPAVRLRRAKKRGAGGRGDHSGLSLEHHAVRKLRPLYPVAAPGREHRVHRRQQRSGFLQVSERKRRSAGHHHQLPLLAARRRAAEGQPDEPRHDQRGGRGL